MIKVGHSDVFYIGRLAASLVFFTKRHNIRIISVREAPYKRFFTAVNKHSLFNGPGEAKGADIALCGGEGEFILYVKGESVGKVSERDAVGKVVEYALSLR